MSDKSVLLKISSRDMVVARSNSNSDFSVSLNNASKLQNVKGIIVKSISFLNSMPNIPHHKTFFKFYIGGDAGVGVEASFSIPSNNYYTANELYLTVKSYIDTAIAPDTCTIVQDNSGATVITTTSTPLSWFPNTPENPNPLTEIMGFTYFSDNTTANVTHTSDGLPQLSGTNRVFIKSNALSNGNMINARTAISENILCSVPIDVSYGTLEHYFAGETKTNMVIYDKVKNLGNIDIKIVDDDNYLVDFKNQHMTLVLMVLY